MQEDGIPADVNLIDVLDFIADCVMAGMARSGSVYPLVLPPELLERAFQNTVELLKANVRVNSEQLPEQGKQVSESPPPAAAPKERWFKDTIRNRLKFDGRDDFGFWVGPNYYSAYRKARQANSS